MLLSFLICVFFLSVKIVSYSFFDLSFFPCVPMPCLVFVFDSVFSNFLINFDGLVLGIEFCLPCLINPDLLPYVFLCIPVSSFSYCLSMFPYLVFLFCSMLARVSCSVVSSSFPVLTSASCDSCHLLPRLIMFIISSCVPHLFLHLVVPLIYIMCF